MNKPPYMRVTYATQKFTDKEWDELGDKVIDDLKKDKVVQLGYRNQIICQWIEEDDRFTTRYQTDCGNVQFFNFGNVFGNDFNYCPFCGGDIEEVTNEST